MITRIKDLFTDFDLPRLLIVAFLSTLLVLAFFLGLPVLGLLTDMLNRLGMFGVLVLAMVPAIVAGVGLNFGLPLGILCGLIGGLVSIELDLSGGWAFAAAIAVAVPLATLVGLGYGWLLNRVKGSEMMVATYVGFAGVSLMCIGWIMLPFRSLEMVWPIGKGLRVTIALSGRYERVLNNFWDFTIGDPGSSTGALTIPTGLLLFFGAMCLLMWLFLRSRMGIQMKTVGDNPKFAVTSGMNVNRGRMIGTILSTVLAAVGILAFNQGFGFIQLYTAPMFMGFTAVAAILIGGATVKKASISNAIIGTFLFQGLLVVSLPVANQIMQGGNLAEISRIIISNGIILYALSQVGGGE